MHRFLVVRVALGVAWMGGLLGARNVAFGQATPPAVMTVRAEGEAAIPLTAADLAALPRVRVEAFDAHRKVTSTFEGVRLADVVAKAGAPLGDDLRGEALATYVVVEAVDGYRVLFALAELDPAFNSREVVLADRRDGQPLGEDEGPFRVVVPGDKRPARWIRMVRSITVGRPEPLKPARGDLER
jgi:hypothetical protein